jgi:hypothetical protein
VVKLALVLALICASAWALLPSIAGAQQSRDPLIAPQEGGVGSRFQVVGQSGWTPDETVKLRLAFVTADPLAYAGPFSVEHSVTVLRDGSWSFPVTVTDTLFAPPFGGRPGYIVVQAQSPTRTAQNAFILTVGGTRPAGAAQIAALGFGAGAPGAAAVVAVGLFAAGVGALCLVSGRARRAA